MLYPVPVHGFEDARTAIAAAAESGRPVILVSAPAAAAHGGPGWFAAMIDAARAEHPDVSVTAILDCADQPGLVLAALRAGVRDISFSGPTDVAARLTAIVSAAGASLHAPPSFAGFVPPVGIAAARELVSA